MNTRYGAGCCSVSFYAALVWRESPAVILGLSHDLWTAPVIALPGCEVSEVRCSARKKISNWYIFELRGFTLGERLP